MTTMLEARDALVAEVEGKLSVQFPTLPRFYGNASFLDEPGLAEFVKVEVRFIKGKQADIGLNPTQRKYGNLTFRVGVKQGSGDRRALEINTFLDANFRTRYVSGVLLKDPQPNGDVDQDEWCIHELFVPFQFEDRTG